MRAVHIEVPGDSQGALALSFNSPEEMGIFAIEMVKAAKLGNTTICQNSPECSPEQGKLNGEVAAFEALTMPPLEVSRVEVPRVDARTLVVVPRRLGSWAPEGSILSSNGNTQPQVVFMPSPGRTKAKVSVIQPWLKMGVTEMQWKAKYS